MSALLMIILIIAITIIIIVWPREDTFIAKFKVKGNYKAFELEISAKQKSVPPSKKEHSIK